MKRFLNFFIVAVSLLGTGTLANAFEPRQTSAERRLTSKIDGVLSDYSKRRLVSGNVLIVGGQTEIVRHIGNANDQTRKPNTAQTRFIIGSTSKQYVATAILKLVDLKYLRLDTPVSRLFPEYPKLNLVGSKGREVLIHHLLNHTSGVPDAYDHPNIRAKLYKKPIVFSEILNAIRFRPLQTNPGEVFSYSNTGYILLGEVVRRLTRMSFADFMEKTFFDPLGLHETTVSWPSPTSLVAFCYQLVGAQRVDFLRYHEVTEIHMQDHFTDGNIITTARELGRWVNFVVAGKVLSPESTRALFASTRPVEYTYGWIVHQNYKGLVMYEHGGEWLGYQSYIRHFPKSGVTLIWTSNQKMHSELQSFIDDLTSAILPSRSL